MKENIEIKSNWKMCEIEDKNIFKILKDFFEVLFEQTRQSMYMP
jgi:hypothetical protein